MKCRELLFVFIHLIASIGTIPEKRITLEQGKRSKVRTFFAAVRAVMSACSAYPVCSKTTEYAGGSAMPRRRPHPGKTPFCALMPPLAGRCTGANLNLPTVTSGAGKPACFLWLSSNCDRQKLTWSRLFLIWSWHSIAAPSSARNHIIDGL